MYQNLTLTDSTKVVIAKDTSIKPQIVTKSHSPQLIGYIGLIIVLKIVIIIYLLRMRKLSPKGKFTINRFGQIPCRNCRYFKDSNYLNCAVHPSIVLTKEAINCSDYCSKSSITKPESTDDHRR